MQINCSGLLSVTMIKHSDPKQHDKKRYIWITLPGSSSSLKEVGAGSQIKNLERGIEAETTGEALLACSDYEIEHLSSPSRMLKV